ncbi:hypothetical protein C2E23DRAFT_860887 [Lenzites betulinus]|nr:hypothetical protein C2E23DRAFT_860887 [Lenzites betulinus]
MNNPAQNQPSAMPPSPEAEAARERPRTPTYAQVLMSPPGSPTMRRAQPPHAGVNAREGLSPSTTRQRLAELPQCSSPDGDDEGAPSRDKGKQRGPPGPPSRPRTPPRDLAGELLAGEYDSHSPDRVGWVSPPPRDPVPAGFQVTGNVYDSTYTIEEGIVQTIRDEEGTWDDFITDGIGRDGRPLPNREVDYSWRARKRMRCETPSDEREGPRHEPPPVWLRDYATASRAPLHVSFSTAKEEQDAMRSRLTEQTEALAAAIGRGSVPPPQPDPEIEQQNVSGPRPPPPPPPPAARRTRAVRNPKQRPATRAAANPPGRVAAQAMEVDVPAANATRLRGQSEWMQGPAQSASAPPAAPVLEAMPDFGAVSPLSLTGPLWQWPHDVPTPQYAPLAPRYTAPTERQPPAARMGSTSTAGNAQSPIPSVLQRTCPATPYPGPNPASRLAGQQVWTPALRRENHTPADEGHGIVPRTAPSPGPGTTVRAMRYEMLATLQPYAPQGITFTPVPEGGYPPHDFGDPEQLLWGLSREFIADLWAQPEGTVVLLQIHGEHYPPAGRVRQITEQLTAAVRVLTSEAGFRIVAPEPQRDARGAQLTSPTTWAAVRLSPQGANTLISRRVISGGPTTFYAYERAIRFPTFLVALGGFTEDEGGEIMEAVWATFNGPQILPVIIRLARTNPALATLSPEDAAAAVISSLIVRVQTMDNGNNIASIYCESPTNSVHMWRRWRDVVAQTPFRSFLNRTGTARTASICAGCHSVSHPTHLCPHPAVPGWNGPPVQTHTRRRAPHPTAPPERNEGMPGAPRGRGGGGRGGRGGGARGGPGGGAGGGGVGRGFANGTNDDMDNGWGNGSAGGNSRRDDRYM